MWDLLLLCFAFLIVASIVSIAIMDFYFIKCPKCNGRMKYTFNVEEDCAIWVCCKCGHKIKIGG